MRDLDRLVFDMGSISPKLALHASLKERAQNLALEIKEMGGNPGALSKGAITRSVLAKRARKREQTLKEPT